MVQEVACLVMLTITRLMVQDLACLVMLLNARLVAT